MKLYYFIILLFLSITSISAMEASFQIKIESDSIKSSSLKNKSFEALNSLFWKNRNDTILIKKIALIYLSKAKRKKNYIQIANAYRIFYELNKKKPNDALKYTDSMIAIPKDVKDIRHPALGHLLKGLILYRNEQYDKALESYLQSQKYAEISNNLSIIIALKHNITLLKTALGKDHEALNAYKENFAFLLSQDTTKRFRQHYLATLYKLSDSYNRLKLYDSANFYLKKGIKSSLSGEHTYYYPDLLCAYGVNSFYRKKYNTALDSLQKAMVLLKENTQDANVRITYLYLAKTLLKIGKEQRAVGYLKRVDTLIHESNYMLENREVFTLLIDHYKKDKDQGNQLKTMEKLIRLDSISNIKNNLLNNHIIKNYDTASLVKEKNQLIKRITYQNKVGLKTEYLLFTLSGIIIMFIFAFLYYNQNRRNRKTQEIPPEDLKQLHKKKATTTSNIDLAPELKQKIFVKLERFEKNHEYLKNNLTLTSVSKSLKTNSTYLSKFINLEKKKNFVNYINDLRIDYCTKQIEENKKFRQYSIKSMAQEVGFNNIQSFAKAFFKKKHCNPAEYVKRTKNQQL
ncbi:hypothetical protein AWE51_06315 [Aquimarina aggregata]|uniref:HTH araC/xylS-type domain-containing protein n=1 Tax=Aquimarina aggregata TaxID=1642818 RepID=A0A163AI40_9FLAO|nr:helix-turn-helix domain-containing protein [Aquimarina aggregata]KZS40560.1 hypothetical protein AWE51_06315 [Aquimarina aggregata]